MEIKVQKKTDKKWVDEHSIFTVSDELREAVDATDDLNSLVQVYLMCRDSKELTKRLKAEWDAPVNSLMDTIGRKMLEVLERTKQEGAKTSAGTISKTKKYSATVADWNVLLEWIQQHDAFHMLKKDIAKEAIKSYMEEHGEIVPGVNFTTWIEAGVRRS